MILLNDALVPDLIVLPVNEDSGADDGVRVGLGKKLVIDDSFLDSLIIQISDLILALSLERIRVLIHGC